MKQSKKRKINMSYIRAGHPLIYVEGESKDYIFNDYGGFIEDYGSISDTGFIELLFQRWKTEDNDFKNHLLKRLADRLNVKLRDKPLTNEEYFELEKKNMEEFEIENMLLKNEE